MVFEAAIRNAIEDVALEAKLGALAGMRGEKPTDGEALAKAKLFALIDANYDAGFQAGAEVDE